MIYKPELQSDNGEDCLTEVFRDGKILKDYSLAECRENTKHDTLNK